MFARDPHKRQNRAGMTAQSPEVSQLLGGSKFGRSNSPVDNTKHLSNMSVTYLYNVLRDMLLKELKDLSL